MCRHSRKMTLNDGTVHQWCFSCAFVCLLAVWSVACCLYIWEPHLIILGLFTSKVRVQIPPVHGVMLSISEKFPGTSMHTAGYIFAEVHSYGMGSRSKFITPVVARHIAVSCQTIATSSILEVFGSLPVPFLAVFITKEANISVQALPCVAPSSSLPGHIHIYHQRSRYLSASPSLCILSIQGAVDCQLWKTQAA